MKIGILCYPTSGGSGVIASELGMVLAARGHDVHLFSYRSPFRLRPHSDRFQWHEISIPQYPLFEYPSYGMAAACHVAEVDLDVLHCHYAYPHAVSAFLAKEMSNQKLKTVTTLHGTDILLVGQDASFTRATKFGLERSDAITAVSAFLRDKTLSWFDVSPKIHVIPDFVDVRRFVPGTGPREMAIVHVSNFRPVKRTCDAVRAFYLIRRRVPATLVLIGTGPEQDAVSDLAGRLGILSSVKFIGEDPEIETHLKQAGLLLSTSEFEGFGMSVLEAMASGVPVVSTESGGVSEVISESCGRTAAVGDVEALAAASVEILRDQNLARSMGEAGRRRAEEMFDVDRVVPQYEALYERVCGASNAENLSV